MMMLPKKWWQIKLIAQMSLLDLTDGSPATHLMPNTLVGTGRWLSDLSLPSSPAWSPLSSSPSSPSPCVDTLSASYLATDHRAQVQTWSEVPRQERQRPSRLWQRLHHHRQPRQQVCCFHLKMSAVTETIARFVKIWKVDTESGLVSKTDVTELQILREHKDYLSVILSTERHHNDAIISTNTIS